MTSWRIDRVAIMIIAALGQSSCGLLNGDDDGRIPLDQDLRVYARSARAHLVHLTPGQRAVLEPRLRAHEQAIARYDRLMARGQTRRAVQAPLMATGAFLVADDVTGFGVANDVAIPFVALGVVAATLATSAPASDRVLRDAYRDVVDTAQAVSDSLASVGVDDPASSESEAAAQPGTREWCIERYTECQETAPRGFSLRNCEPCMRKCMAQGNEWPETTECDYKRRQSIPRPRWRIKR